MNQNIDQSYGNRTNYRLLFYTLCLANSATGIALILPAAMLPLLVEHTQIPIGFAGWIFASFSFGTLFNAITLGAIRKSINPKYLLLSGMAILGTTSLVVALTHVFSILLIAQFFSGIAFGLIYISSNMLTTLFFLDTLSEMLNKVQSAFSTGALLGPLLLSFSLQMLGDPIWAFCIITFLACMTIGYLILVDVPAATEQNMSLQKSAKPSRPLFKEVMFWFALSQVFLYMGAEVGFGNWIVAVVSNETAITLALAAPVVTFFWFGSMSGSMLSAFLLEHDIVSEHFLLYYCFLGGCLSALLVVFFPGNIWTCFGASLLMGLFLGPIFPSIMAITSRYFVERLGLVSSAMSFCGELAAFACPTAMSLVIAHFGFNWGMLLPAFFCLLITVPFSLAWWWQAREKSKMSKNVSFPLNDLVQKQATIPQRAMSGSLEC